VNRWRSISVADTLLEEINARRCAFCGSDRAHFGYGPPLVHTPFWTCRTHRPNAEACAAAGTTPQPSQEPETVTGAEITRAVSVADAPGHP
jgi:hypothetical protein